MPHTHTNTPYLFPVEEFLGNVSLKRKERDFDEEVEEWMGCSWWRSSISAFEVLKKKVNQSF